MSAWVSPPQESTSHMVVTAASMAHAASTGLPPFWNVIAPAVAASGLPVMATQWRPCSAGFWVRWPTSVTGEKRRASATKRTAIRDPAASELGNISCRSATRHPRAHQVGTARRARALAALPRADSIGSLFSLGGRGMRCSSVLCRLALTFGIIAPGSLTAQGGSVAGTVVNRATGAPVAAAQVTVAGTGLRAFTDASGRFTLNDVLGTTAVLQIRMIGFRARTDTVTVGDTNVRIALDQKALELEQ